MDTQPPASPISQMPLQPDSDPVIEVPVRRHRVKKIALSLGVGLFVIVVIGGSIVLSHKSAKQLPADISNPIQTAQTSTTPEPSTQKHIANNYFSVSFPNSWTGRQYTVIGGGGRIALFPANGDDIKTFPHFDIEVSPNASQAGELERVQALAPLQLTETTINFKGESATQLSGVLPFTFKVGNPPADKTVNKTFLVLSHNGYMYILDYAYVVGNSQNDLNTLQQIISSFSFTN